MSDDLKFTVQRPPAYGELTDLLPGMFWVRLPMPTIPNHVNCWLLDDGPGWTLVDCGLNTDDTFEIYFGWSAGPLNAAGTAVTLRRTPAGFELLHLSKWVS